MLQSQINVYREREILTADRGRLLILTFDALIAALTRARVAIEMTKGDVASDAIDKARAILGELLATLDHEKGGDIASQLASLYVFVMCELDEIAIKPDAMRLRRNIAVVGELRDAFARIATPAGPVS